MPTSRGAALLLALPLMAGCAAAPSHAVIPVPASIRVAPDEAFTIDSTAAIGVLTNSDAAHAIARQLAEVVGTLPESRPPVLPAGHPDAATAALRLSLDSVAHGRLGPEGYALTVDASGARIEAAGAAGLFYGVQTLRQLLPPVLEYGAARPGPVRVPYATIEDRPRYGWRGAMLDVARHFFDAEEVKRYIDLLALYKINRLHLHLADDQGWRIEVPAWPRLTEHGGSTEVGGGPGGFYTVDDYAGIVQYAAERYMTVVPEIDMPGHTNAALASIPELNCDGVAPELYTGIEVGFSALCVTSEATYEFVDGLVAHLAAITPGPWIHIGGDEVETLTDEEYAGFIERVETIVHRHGKRMVGWGEIAAARVSGTTLLQHWHGDGAGLADAHAGQVILSPATNVYIDMKYHAGTPIGLDWASLTSLRKAYDWDPTTLVPGLPANAIAGLEAPLWAETLATIRDIEYLAFPRIAAVAELAWSTPEATDWNAFRQRVARHGPRWIALGINFYRSPEIDWNGW